MKRILRKIMLFIFVLFYDGNNAELNEELCNAFYGETHKLVDRSNK